MRLIVEYFTDDRVSDFQDTANIENMGEESRECAY